MRRAFAAALAALLLAWPALAQIQTAPQVIDPSTGKYVKGTGQASGAQNVNVENTAVGLIYYQGNVLQGGSTILRCGVDRTINGAKARDSTIVLPTYGARVVHVYVYAVPDSGVHSDSSRVAWLGVLPKGLLAAAPDSSVAAVPTPVFRDSFQAAAYTPGTTLGGTTIGERGFAFWPDGMMPPSDGPTLGYGYIGAGLNAENVNICASVAPGEVLVPVPFYATFSFGEPRWRFFELRASDFGATVLPPYLALVFRFYGISAQIPCRVLAKIPTRRMYLRVDVEFLR